LMLLLTILPNLSWWASPFYYMMVLNVYNLFVI
jgi:hypothetical protein